MMCKCPRLCVCMCTQCVLGSSSQPIEVSRSIIKACHWLVHELGRPIRETDVRSEWKKVRVTVKRKREWADKERQSLGLRVREMQSLKIEKWYLTFLSVFLKCSSDPHLRVKCCWSVLCRVLPCVSHFVFTCCSINLTKEFPSYNDFSFYFITVSEDWAHLTAVTWVEEYQVRGAVLSHHS